MGRVSPAFVDSNVILDIATRSPWSTWAADALARAGDEAPVYINAVIYAEVSVYATSMEDLDERLDELQFVPMPREAAFLAGKAHGRYAARGGTWKSPLPDLLIGAHAQVLGCRVLTRDPRRFRTYFPRLVIVSPPSTLGG